MKRITPGRVALFVVVMAAVAFAVYLLHSRRQPERTPAALAQQHPAQAETGAGENAANAAAQRAEYMARYLNRGFARQPGVKAVAIAAEFQNGESDRSIADALADRFQNPNLVLITSFFKPAFFTDGTFSNIFAGSTEPIYNLGLTNQLDGLLLAQEQVQYSTNGTSLHYVITAKARLKVGFLPFDMMRLEQSWTLLANGRGSSQPDARTNAEQRLLKQIADDNSMSLFSQPSENQEIFSF